MNKILKKKLMEAIGKKLALHGFQPKLSRQHYFKTIPSGKLIFHLAFIDHKDDFDITADMGIRFDELERMVNLENKLLKGMQIETCSLGVEVGNLSEGRQKRWTVSTEADVIDVSNNISLAFERFALPYFEKYSDFRIAFDLLSADGKVAWIHSPIHGERAKRVLGLAVLLGYRGRILELIGKYRKTLQEMNDFGLSEFESFSQIISRNFLESQ
jgi:hypothetical protein